MTEPSPAAIAARIQLHLREKRRFKFYFHYRSCHCCGSGILAARKHKRIADFWVKIHPRYCSKRPQ